MGSILYLCLIYLLIYSAMIHILNTERSIFPKKDFSNFTGVIIVGVTGFSMLLGGILASFVVPAIIIFIISIIFFFIGGILWIFLGKFGYLLSNIMLANSFGLFKFVFIVILLDQNKSNFIQFKVAVWFFTQNLCSLIIYTFLPKNETINYKIFGPILILTITILVVYGVWKKIYTIDSDLINITEFLQSLNRPRGLWRDENNIHSQQIIISISKSVIIFLLLLPYGICDSQEHYVYEFQTEKMYKPNISFLVLKGIFWTKTFISISTMITIIILFGFNHCLYYKSKYKYRDFKMKVIIGNILMILSTIICGVLEVFLVKNQYRESLNSERNSKERISIFYMIPQIVFLVISEVFVIPTCIEFLYWQSIKGTKYLSIALLLSAVESGGIADLFSIIIYKSIYVDNTKMVIVIFAQCGIGILSFIISLILMMKFKSYFNDEKQRKSDIKKSIIESSFVETR